MKPPIPKSNIKKTEHLSHERIDAFSWLRDVDDPKVMEYLHLENTYTRHSMQATEPLQEQLIQEMFSRVPVEQTTAPYPTNGWLRYARIRKGENYWVYCRSKDNHEEILIDENDRAKGRDYYALEALSLSPTHQWMAWSEDLNGQERFTIQLRNLQTNQTQTVPHTNIKWTIAWLDDHRLVYVGGDAADRPCEVRIHDTRTPNSSTTIWKESNEHFYMTVERSRCGLGVICRAESKSSSDVRILRPTSPVKLETILPKVSNVKYDVSLVQNNVLIRSNQLRRDFALYTLNNHELVPFWIPEEGTTIEQVDILNNHIVCWVRSNATQQIMVLNLQGILERSLSFPDPCYELYPDINPSSETNHFRLRYSSLSCPDSVFEYCLTTGSSRTLKVFNVPNFDPDDWECRRLWTTSTDGTQIPVSIVQKKNAPNNQPMLLHGYGAYGVSYSTGFHESWLCLMERGWSIGIAHVRGGGELGRNWYESGKLQNKQTSFDDFIVCCEFLIDQQITTSKSLVICGGSAGGLLMGGVLNQRPLLVAGCVAEVPFVDVTNTMLDPTLPLTIIEYEEWGNPNILKQYQNMMKYDPYQQFNGQQYPSLLVTAGITDPRVGFWEPAKWVAKIRNTLEDSSKILLLTHMSAGHSGSSGREQMFIEDAFKVAFILNCVDPIIEPLESPSNQL